MGKVNKFVANAIKLYYDKKGNTLTVWFDDPEKEAFVEEVGDDGAVMKDKKGKVIGFEKLNYMVPLSKSPSKNFPTEVMVI